MPPTLRLSLGYFSYYPGLPGHTGAESERAKTPFRSEQKKISRGSAADCVCLSDTLRPCPFELALTEPHTRKTSYIHVYKYLQLKKTKY